MARFPRRIPADQPPPISGEISEDGRRVPTYVLAWTCPADRFFEIIGGGADYSNVFNIVRKKWVPLADSAVARANEPLPFPGQDGNYYLVALFNEPGVDHKNRVRDIQGDPLISIARAAMNVDKDPDIEGTLQWLRWPLNWVRIDTLEREMAEELAEAHT